MPAEGIRKRRESSQIDKDDDVVKMLEDFEI
jgi:hypothetical protein